MPWNFSFAALENFLINTKFCKDDLGDCARDNRAQLLTQFVDYVLSENASKWRDAEPFLTTGNWNKGTCNKQAGSCFSLRGVPLRHVCDHRTDPTNLMIFCGQNHKRLVAHP